MIPLIFGHFSDQLGTHQVIHCFQMISGKFQQFDYGKSQNIDHYGQNEPPIYNLKNARAPVALYYAESDSQVVPKDVKKLIAELPNVALDYLVPHKEFNHGDFAYGKDARRLVYDKMLEMMKTAEK